ncbi:MAG: hypothetical protein MUO72_09775 [Bacteroidales bacterium]|nr:hypothetical protein [Bacteroidales bacterium]
MKPSSFLIILLILSPFSCQKVQFPDPNTLPKGLIGSWVETNTRTDTIIFVSNRDTGIFWLQRGFEIRNGYRLPVIGSTGYHYEIFSDSIKVVDGLSSAWEQGTYYFHFDEPNLTINIGKFSKYINTRKSILTFRKIN